ncbi:MAG: hypothetical protein A3F46_03335 [Legionellales bacterium RIFCSPHIGHO2_12_FULL_42_9]|nr:MAG: hypothetical protein A3F46_03335 [Legionellales bacterium RIFCSPHIGHO2_12_FULL_42_9]
MIQLQQLIKPTWGVEKWLNTAWATLNDDEKQIISKRVEDLFFNPIPFQLEYDKILYIHLFTLLTQLEIFALQGMIKSLGKLSAGELHTQLRQQIMDEIFHATVFAKITYELASPYALPPMYSKGVENFFSILVNEPDFKTSLVMINLVGEGWIDEIFCALQKANIAPRVFDVVHEDESRHLHDYVSFLEIGLPNKAYLTKRLAYFEEELAVAILAQNTYVQTLITFLGVDGAKALFNKIDQKHYDMLKKIDCVPGKRWQFFMKHVTSIIQEVFHDQSNDQVIEPTVTRQVLTALWDAPNQPTQSSVFNVDVTPVQFFEKKFKSETITCLSLQALSKAMSDNPVLKNYMSHLKLYKPKDSFVALAVLLPGCDDHLSLIEFKNCHEMSLAELSEHIQHDLQFMVYCYKRVEKLKKEHPYLMDIFDGLFIPQSETIFGEPLLTRPSISLSNVGQWGYEVPISPLLPYETVKLTLAKIDRRQVWNNDSKLFEVRDILPVGMSVDHRVFDGNIAVPRMIQTAFDEMFNKMQQDATKAAPVKFSIELNEFMQLSEKLLQDDLDLGFRYLFFSSQVWKNYSGAHTFLSHRVSNELVVS